MPGSLGSNLHASIVFTSVIQENYKIKADVRLEFKL